MLYQHKLVLESIQDPTKPLKIYHYIDNKNTLNKIKDSGYLYSVNYLNNQEQNKYIGRITEKSPNQYFEYVYNKKFKPIIKKPYITYGIYFTPVDLFNIGSKLKYRITFNYNDLLKIGDVTFEHGRQFNDVILLNKSEKQIKREFKKYPVNKNDISNLYFDNKKEYVFENLPEVIVWSNMIKIKPSQIEYEI